jgi:hypothetical protein
MLNAGLPLSGPSTSWIPPRTFCCRTPTSCGRSFSASEDFVPSAAFTLPAPRAVQLVSCGCRCRSRRAARRPGRREPTRYSPNERSAPATWDGRRRVRAWVGQRGTPSNRQRTTSQKAGNTRHRSILDAYTAGRRATLWRHRPRPQTSAQGAHYTPVISVVLRPRRRRPKAEGRVQDGGRHRSTARPRCWATRRRGQAGTHRRLRAGGLRSS